MLTSSVHAALQRMRFRDRPRRIWAGQVCIDQSNILERGLQVKLMNRIFENGLRVLAWLGDDYSKSSSQVSKLIEQMAPLDLSEDERMSEFEGIVISALESLRLFYDLPWVRSGIGMFTLFDKAEYTTIQKDMDLSRDRNKV
jgi:hypothetical protein